MKVIKYSFPLNKPRVIGPQMSVWINSRGLVTENYFSNCLLICFPITHPSQNLFSKLRFGSPCTDCFFTKSLRPLYSRYPNLICHNQASSSLLILRYFCSILYKFSLNIMFSHISTQEIVLPRLSFKCRVLFFMKISNPFSINWPTLRILLFIFRM
jgi:hypothetical protein